MTNKQIFKKAILKAEKNGFDIVQYLPAFPPKDFFAKEKNFILLYAIKEKIIFSHDFAKAFWKNNTFDFIDKQINPEPLPVWKHCLQEMVKEKKPLKYIEKFLKVEK